MQSVSTTIEYFDGAPELPGEKLERLLSNRGDFPEAESVLGTLKHEILGWDFEAGEKLQGVNIPLRKKEAYQVADEAIEASATLDPVVKQEARSVISGRIASLLRESKGE